MAGGRFPRRPTNPADHLPLEKSKARKHGTTK
ncbi:hypothetical protein MY3296_007986 [Beauveria thailandica]